MHHSSRFVGRIGGTILAVALAMPGSGCSRSEPSAPVSTVPPRLTSISPNFGARGTTVAVTFTGSNFVVGASKVIWTSAVVVTSQHVLSSTSIVANVSIPPFAAIGDANLWVTSGPWTSDILPFTVLPPPPTISTITPNFGSQGTTVAVILTGTNFIVGATTVVVNGLGVTPESVSVQSGTLLYVNFAIAAGATLGADGVTVTTAGGTSVSVPFTVNAGAPVTQLIKKRGTYPQFEALPASL